MLCSTDIHFNFVKKKYSVVIFNCGFNTQMKKEKEIFYHSIEMVMNHNKADDKFSLDTSHNLFNIIKILFFHTTIPFT